MIPTKYNFHDIKSLGGVRYRVKTCHFLLPAGGAMTIAEYGHVDLFRSGALSNISNLGKIGHCMAELLQLPVSWRIIEICQAATDTPFNENSRSSQFNVTKGFRLHLPNLVFI